MDMDSHDAPSLDSAGPVDVNPPKPEDVLTTALTHQDFPVVMSTLDEMLEVHRNPFAVNWCFQHGYRHGHVPVLERLVWNQLRFGVGRVPSVEDLKFAVNCAVLLLLRCAQDIVASRRHVAKRDRETLFVCLLSHVKYWTLRWDATVLPSPAAIADFLAQWLGSGVVLPLPTWCVAANVHHRLLVLDSKPATYITWGKPDDLDDTAFRVSRDVVNATRAQIATHFLSIIRSCETLLDVLEKVSGALCSSVT